MRALVIEVNPATPARRKDIFSMMLILTEVNSSSSNSAHSAVSSVLVTLYWTHILYEMSLSASEEVLLFVSLLALNLS